jgi:hypothetical protein
MHFKIKTTIIALIVAFCFACEKPDEPRVAYVISSIRSALIDYSHSSSSRSGSVTMKEAALNEIAHHLIEADKGILCQSLLIDNDYAVIWTYGPQDANLLTKPNIYSAITPIIGDLKKIESGLSDSDRMKRDETFQKALSPLFGQIKSRDASLAICDVVIPQIETSLYFDRELMHLQTKKQDLAMTSQTAKPPSLSER